MTDFGIARSLDVEHGVTQTGTVLGTSDYIAPEQAQRPAGRRADRRLLARRRALRAADGRGAVHGRQLRRRRDAAHQRAAARACASGAPTVAAAARRGGRARAGEGAARPLPRRWTSSSGARGVPARARRRTTPAAEIDRRRARRCGEPAAPARGRGGERLAADHAPRSGARRSRRSSPRSSRSPARRRATRRSARGDRRSPSRSRASAPTTRRRRRHEHDADAPNATDRNPATYWTTEHYHTLHEARASGSSSTPGRAVKLAER